MVSSGGAFPLLVVYEEKKARDICRVSTKYARQRFFFFLFFFLELVVSNFFLFLPLLLYLLSLSSLEGKRSLRG